jgi:hypothetical protein
MELAGALFEARQKTKGMTVDAYRKFLHTTDPAIRRRDRGGAPVDIY